MRVAVVGPLRGREIVQFPSQERPEWNGGSSPRGTARRRGEPRRTWPQQSAGRSSIWRRGRGRPNGRPHGPGGHAPPRGPQSPANRSSWDRQMGRRSYFPGPNPGGGARPPWPTPVHTAAQDRVALAEDATSKWRGAPQETRGARTASGEARLERAARPRLLGRRHDGKILRERGRNLRGRNGV